MKTIAFYRRSLLLSTFCFLVPISFYLSDNGFTPALYSFLSHCLLVAVSFFLLGRYVFSKNTPVPEHADDIFDGTPTTKKMVQVMLFFPVGLMLLAIATLYSAADPLGQMAWMHMSMALQIGQGLEAVLRLRQG
jgi:uncharacterized sodium:solute symporter family permease YidK